MMADVTKLEPNDEVNGGGRDGGLIEDFSFLFFPSATIVASGTQDCVLGFCLKG